MKNQCGTTVGFYLELPCCFGSDLVYAKHQWSIFVKFITISMCRAVKFSNFLSFPLPTVMNLLVFLYCFLAVFHVLQHELRFNSKTILYH